MTRCIIHIGMHKTGSSSIQSSLDGLDDATFRYADLGVSNHSLAMYSLFSEHPERHHLHKANRREGSPLDEYIEGMQTSLEKVIESLNGRTLIISGEDIGSLSKAGLSKLHQYFQNSFSSITIVAYVRPPAAFISSAFQQRVKGTGLNEINIKQEYRNYRESFAKFDEIFGRENVLLWKFSPSGFPSKCVVRDFCGRLGIDLPEEKIVRVNESLSRRAISLLYTFNKFSKKYGFKPMKGPEGMRFGKAFSAPDDGKFHFSSDIIRPILEENAVDVAWIEGRLGESLSEELSESKSDDIRGESDLLTPDPVTVNKLLALLGDSQPEGIQGESPDEVALLVQAFREKNKKGRKKGQNATVKTVEKKTAIQGKKELAMDGNAEALIKPNQLIRSLKEMHPELFHEISPKMAVILIRDVFRQINERVVALDDGVLDVAGLGRFKVTTRQMKGKDGQDLSRMRIMYQPQNQRTDND